MKPVAYLAGTEPIRLRIPLEREGWGVVGVAEPGEALRGLRGGGAGALVVGLPAGAEAAALDLVRLAREASAGLTIVVLAEHGSEPLAVAALRAGATDYFSRPWAEADVVRRLGPASARRGEPPRPQPGAVPPPRLVGTSAFTREVEARIAALAQTDATVLITGETGTGKELVAALLHRASRRAAGAFVCVNCAAVPDTLLESELFGHERGAFTGAHARHEGTLAVAAGGTVLLDEVGDMSPLAQAKVLRVVETRQLHRLGARGAVPVDVRFVAATNQDLERAVEEGRFRRDLYYRLNVARLHLAPLRERRDDVPALAEHLLQDLNARLGTRAEGLADDAMERLLLHDWPGNVRELRNVLEGALVTCRAGRIGSSDLPAWLLARTEGRRSEPDELGRLLGALEATHWNKSQAARRLHWSRVTLYRKLWKYRLATRAEAHL